MGKKAIYFKGEELIQRATSQKVLVEVDFVQCYLNRYEYTCRLKSVWSSKYFDWLLCQINDLNEITIGFYLHRKFYESIQKIGMTPPSDRTMKDVMKELVAERLLLRVGRGRYKLNPMIIWKDLAKTRIENIQGLVNIDVLIDANVGSQIVEETPLNPSHTISRGDSLEEANERIWYGEPGSSTSEGTENQAII